MSEESEIERSNNNLLSVDFEGQYSLLKIVIIWVAAAGPMAIMGWVVGPALESLINVHEGLKLGVARTIALTIGLIWLFVLSMIIVRIEEGDLKWSSIRRRLWLNKPIDPKSGKRGERFGYGISHFSFY